MKITKAHIRKIIKEELGRIQEGAGPAVALKAMSAVLPRIEKGAQLISTPKDLKVFMDAVLDLAKNGNKKLSPQEIKIALTSMLRDLTGGAPAADDAVAPE
jgi:hypothetical protein